MFLFVNGSGKFILFFIFVGLMVFFFLNSGSDLVWFGLKWFWEDLVVVSAMTYDYD